MRMTAVVSCHCCGDDHCCHCCCLPSAAAAAVAAVSAAYPAVADGLALSAWPHIGLGEKERES